MSNEKKEKKLVSQIHKAIEWVIISFLYLIFIHWVARSCYKYMEEPTSTYIRSEIIFLHSAHLPAKYDIFPLTKKKILLNDMKLLGSSIIKSGLFLQINATLKNILSGPFEFFPGYF